MANFNDTQHIEIPTVQKDDTLNAAKVLREVYAALKEKGYDPENQIVGYIMSGDPTYITNHKNARATIAKIDRDELLNALVRNFLKLK